MSRITSTMVRTGKVAVLAAGLATVLVVTLATVAGTAEAAKAQTLKAGVQNAVRAMTSMAGSLAEPVLRLDNNGTGAALDLEVQDGGAPLTVNGGAGTATGLSADELDGKDSSSYVASDIYRSSSATSTGNDLGDGTRAIFHSCDPGDKLLSGGAASINVGTVVMESFPDTSGAWKVRIDNADGTLDAFAVVLLCADQQ